MRTHPEDRRPEGSLQYAISAGLSLDREFRIIMPNGRLRWLRTRAEVLLNSEGIPERTIGLVTDVTLENEAESRNRSTEARQAALSQAANCTSWVTHPEGTIVEFDEWAKENGEGSAVLLGPDWFTKIHPDDRKHSQSAWEKSAADKSIFDVEHRILQPDGVYKWCRSRAVPIVGINGAILEWVGATSEVQPESICDASSDSPMITGVQIRSARGALMWSVRELAEKAEVSVAILRRLEEFDGHIEGSRAHAAAVKSVLEKSGVEFLTFKRGKPGIRMR